MARKQVDVFGFDELEKAFDKMEKKLSTGGDALLAAEAEQVKKRAKQLTPVSSKNKPSGDRMKPNWRTLKPKEYHNGMTLVSRVQDKAYHTHLFELGHKSYTTRGNRKLRYKVARYNAMGKKVQGVSKHNDVEGRHVLEKAMNEARARFQTEIPALIQKLKAEGRL